MPRFLAQPRTTLIVLGLLVLLAVLGWSMYLSVRSGYDAQQARFNQERAELTGRVADLEGTLASERAAAGDLATLTARIEKAKSELNQRMTVLGEREHDLAAREAALTGLQSRLGSLTEARDRATGRLNQRLEVLGERERELAETERTLGHTRTERDRLRAENANLEQTLAGRKTALGALEVRTAALARAQSKSASELDHTRSALAATQARLTEVGAKLDKVLLAEGVAELTARRTALQQEVASLNGELARKRPLFHQSVSVNRKLLDLDEQLRSLSVERDRLTAELQKLVARLGQAQAGRDAPPESLARLTGE